MNVAGNLGPKPVVLWDGKPYSLSFFCPAVVVRMVAAVVDQCYAAVDAIGSPRARARAEKALNDRVSVGHHEYGESLFRERVGTLRGSPLLLWACVADNHPEFTFDDAHRMARESSNDVARALLLIEPGFFEELFRLGALDRPSKAPPTKVPPTSPTPDPASPPGSPDTPAS